MRIELVQMICHGANSCFLFLYIYAAVAVTDGDGGGGSFMLFTVSFNDAIHNHRGIQLWTEMYNAIFFMVLQIRDKVKYEIYYTWNIYLYQQSFSSTSSPTFPSFFVHVKCTKLFSVNWNGEWHILSVWKMVKREGNWGYKEGNKRYLTPKHNTTKHVRDHNVITLMTLKQLSLVKWTYLYIYWINDILMSFWLLHLHFFYHSFVGCKSALDFLLSSESLTSLAL